MLKKQIQKLRNLYHITPHLLLAFALVSGLFFVPLKNESNIKEAYAQQTKYCLVGGPDSTRDRAATSININVEQVLNSSQKPTGIKGTFDATYADGGNDFLSDQISCNTSKFEGKILILGGFTNSAVSGALPIEFEIQPAGAGLKLTGSFTIPNLKAALPSYYSTVKEYLGQGDITNNSKNGFNKTSLQITIKELAAGSTSRATTTPFTLDGNPKFIYQYEGAQVYLWGCGEEICAQTGKGGVSSDPVGENELLMKLDSLYIAERTNVAEAFKQYVPTAKRGDRNVNFIRVYLDDKSREIIPFAITSETYPRTPIGKTLYIGSGTNTTKVFLIDNSTDATFAPKKVLGLGSGIFNKTIKFNSSTDFGCTKDTFSSSYLYGNKDFGFNLCNTRSGLIEKSGIAIKIDGDAGRLYNLQLDNKSLIDLKANIPVKCTDPVKGEGCDDVVNKIQVAPIMTIDADFANDSSWTGALFTSPITDIKNIYKALYYWSGVPLVYAPEDFYVQIYPSKTAWEAHKDDPPPAIVPDAKDVAGSAQSKTGDSQSLYAFLVRVISYIVIFLTGLIYKIFAYFVVPVLNALLQVRPYKDTFVNIIYPGWLILRNLANIFFIISMLYVGLKILFQQSAASTAMSFIKRLIIMALLVNFSLVVAQGIVGIADTVQSQFLPANTKVIEALGSKLMVEPILSFRSAIGNGDPNGEVKDDLTISDTAKPIVLLVLAIAAFFSFIAIAAFLAVRLVALLVLYMVSPVAYVGFVMEDTKSYASLWWNNFLKYAFLTPILVFFLNIAALVAITTSSNTGNVLKLDDTISGDLVAGGLTIATHFIVLFFIYAGMIVAQKSGTIGSTAIVNAAKKGFDSVTKTAPKWVGGKAAGLAKSAANNQYERNIKGGLFDPMAYKKAWKDGTEAKNKKMMSARLAKSEGRLTPDAMVNNKKAALKYVLSGGRFKGNKLQSEQERLQEEAGILLDTDRTARNGDKSKAEHDQDLLNRGKLSFEQAQKVVDNLDSKAKDHAAKRDSLDDDSEELKLKGRFLEAAAKKTESIEQERLRKEAEDAKTALQTRATRAKGMGEEGVLLNNSLKAQIGIAFNEDEVKKELQKTIDNLDAQISTDDTLKAKYGYGPGGKTMDPTRKDALEKEIEAISKQINERELPITLAQREARLSRQKEQDKHIEDIDDKDELTANFQTALSENNLDLAIAISKKMAKEGNFDHLLEQKGKDGKAYGNNIEGFQKFMNEKFAKMAPRVRMQVGSEISSLGEKNGNLAIGKSAKIGAGGSISWHTQTAHNDIVDKILKGKTPDKLVESKKYEITRQTASGGHTLYKGAKENFDSMNKAKLDKLAEKMSSKLASHIMDADNFKSLKVEVQTAIKSAAGK